MRIAFVNTLYPPYGSSGAEVTLRFLARQLSERGHSCTIITLTPGRVGLLGEIDGITVHYLPLANVYWPHQGRRPAALRPIFQALDAFNPLMERRLKAILQGLRPDVVNAHNLQGFSVSAWRAADRLGIPLVQTLHDYYTACPRSAMWRPGSGNCTVQCVECRLFSLPRRRVSRLPTVVTCVSRRLFDRIAGTGMFAAATAGRQAVRIIRGNNPDVELPPLPPPRREATPWRFGAIGRLDPTKGIEILIDAMAGLTSSGATLAIAGSGPENYVDRLRARAARVPGIRFLGHVAPETFFREIDTLVIPSVWEDPFPRVFHEAMAYGVPSLVTPLGGLPEAIDPGRTGSVAEGADAPSLARAMQNLLDSATGHETMRQACRAAALAYQPAHIVSQYEAALAAAVSVSSIQGPGMQDAGEAWYPGPAHTPGLLPQEA
jgi:glycosyltransferase involved in cell wall biosynthesis